MNINIHHLISLRIYFKLFFSKNGQELIVSITLSTYNYEVISILRKCTLTCLETAYL